MSKLYGEGVSWLDTGLTNKQLRDVGLITIVWNASEFDLQELIITLGGWSPWQGFLVTTDLQNVSRLQLGLNLLRHGYKNQRLFDDVDRALQFFDECRKCRNSLVHGIPVLDDGGKLSGRLARFDAKQAKGKIKISHLSCTSEHLEQLITDLWLCRMALTDARRKVSRYRGLASDAQDPLPSQLEKEIFEYADQPLDIKLLQSRLDFLRSQPPTPSKYPSRPE